MIKGAPVRGGLGRGSSGSRGSRGGNRNLDPGVNSEDEEDDMFRFDALSHGSSGSSLDNLGGGELLGRARTTTTPGQNRRSFAPSHDSPLVLNSNEISTSGKQQQPKVPTTEDMDDWELKLLGKKGVPYTPPSVAASAASDFKNQRDNLSLISGMSLNSGHSGGGGGLGGIGAAVSVSGQNSRANTLERPTKLVSQSGNTLLPMHTPSGHKKKIIPVHSDFESSPSPEDCPSSPNLDDSSSSRSSSTLNTPS